MGDRTNIAIITNKGEREERVYLYGHWMGDGSIVHAEVGLRSGRTDDAAYLARIIFSSMVKDDLDGETGYGIDTQRTLDDHPLIVIDPFENTVRLEDDSNKPLTAWVSNEEFLAAISAVDPDEYGALDKLAQALPAVK